MKKLVGQGKPFHSAVDKAAGMLKRKVGTGAEFMKELMGITGIKPTEIQERGLTEIMGMPRMTHDQFMAALASKPAPAIQEKLFADSDSKFHKEAADDAHHEKWTLPGGENYREMLIKAPSERTELEKKYMELDAKLRHAPLDKRSAIMQQIDELKDKYNKAPEVFGGVGGHFGGEPGILASMRLKDRTGPNGEKLLHLEELQSDWHQQGREKGYGNTINEQGHFDVGIPDAPFKKNWEEMALKRLIHHAAEKGYHSIVVTPGIEQADRYSLAKHISGVDYIRNELKPHRNEMIAYDPKGNVIFNEFGMTPEKLEQHIGKEAAQKLLSQEPQPNQYGLPTHSLRGEQLVVGGEGMKAFYDKKVPNILNSIGKKYGVKTQLHRHPIANPKKDLSITHMLAESGMSEDQWQATPMDQRQAMVDQYEKDSKNRQAQLHHFPITEEMRKDVLANGLPLYAGGGEVDAEEVFMGKGGKVKEPKSTVKAYKLFRVDERHPGKLFPLFVNANQPVEMNKWVNAEVGPQTDKGKVKSKLGPLAYRPGWHSGDLPVATHIGEGGKPPTHRPRNQAWAEVEVPNDVDWQTEANKRGINKQGKLIAREAHITDQIPKGGHYRYKTNPNMTGNWLISGSMKVNKVLSHPEVERINKKAGVSDLPRKEPFNKKDFGFKYGGDVDAESYFFPNKE